MAAAPTLGGLIPGEHVARLVNDAIDGMDLGPILNTYEGGGQQKPPPNPGPEGGFLWPGLFRGGHTLFTFNGPCSINFFLKC